jgi:hypothetical protein
VNECDGAGFVSGMTLGRWAQHMWVWIGWDCQGSATGYDSRYGAVVFLFLLYCNKQWQTGKWAQIDLISV